MDKKMFTLLIEDFLRNSGLNVISADQALCRGMAGLEIFGDPLLGVAAAEDPAFRDLQEEGVVGPHFMLPDEWLSGAKSVISFFLPFTERVRMSNRAERDEPSPEWLHARIEGQACIDRLSHFLVEELRQAGHRAVAPSVDSRFRSCTAVNTVFLDGNETPLPVSFTSNWSERHAAYVCGLGSFGLSKGLITSKGIAGRFDSIITTLALPSDNVIPSSPYENCTLCGECAQNCPADAISISEGKDHVRCSEYLDMIRKKHQPRYGCGKCQTGVPCESEIPPRRLQM
jgi:epoxyqueuosine reductase QueG